MERWKSGWVIISLSYVLTQDTGVKGKLNLPKEMSWLVSSRTSCSALAAHIFSSSPNWGSDNFEQKRHNCYPSWPIDEEAGKIITWLGSTPEIWFCLGLSWQIGSQFKTNKSRHWNSMKDRCSFFNLVDGPGSIFINSRLLPLIIDRVKVL